MESNNAAYFNWFKMHHHFSPLSWGAHNSPEHRPESNYELPCNYHHSHSYQQSKPNTHYGISNPKPYYINEQLMPLNNPGPNDFPSQNPSQYTPHYGGQFTHTYHQEFNGLPSHQRSYHTPYGNRQTGQPQISEENRFSTQNPQEYSNPTSHYNGQQNLPNITDFTDSSSHPHPYHKLYANRIPEQPSKPEQNNFVAQNPQEHWNPTWYNNGQSNLPNTTDVTILPPHKHPYHTPYGNILPQQQGIPEQNWFPDENPQENWNPNGQNMGESNLPYATDLTSFPPDPNDIPHRNRPLEQPSILEQNWFPDQNYHEDPNTSWQNNGESNLANATGFTSNLNGSNENINSRFRPTGESLIFDRLLAPSYSTMGNQLDAFNISDTFGTDYNPKISLGPTGVQYDTDNGTNNFATPCFILGENPQMPDFRAEGRRISEVRCYEYIWELKVKRNCRNPPSNINNNNVRGQRSVSMAEGDMPKIGVINGYPVIVNAEGFFVSTEGFAHMAALGWNGVNGDLVFKCGATLISANFLLTAAHCTSSAPDPTLSDLVPRIARIGGINIGYTSERGKTPALTDSRRNVIKSINPDQVDVRIINIIVHEEYNPNRRYYDIALMQLEYSLQFSKYVQPACLWSDINTSKRIKKAVIAGWGVTSANSFKQAEELVAGEVDIIDTDICDNLLSSSFGSKFDGVADHQLCAGKLSGDVDTCQGDSGGPLQVQIQLPFFTAEKMHTIVGVISAGVGCAIPNTPSLYTRVASFIDWIEERVWS